MVLQNTFKAEIVKAVREQFGLGVQQAKEAIDFAHDRYSGDLLAGIGHVHARGLAVHIRGDRDAWNVKQALKWAEDHRTTPAGLEIRLKLSQANNGIDMVPGHEHIGHDIADIEARETWRDLVAEIYKHTQPGGALEGYLFHGTSGERSDSIEQHGLMTSDVLMRHEEETWWTEGTYWGTLPVASYYAEDAVFGRYDGDVPDQAHPDPVFVAVHTSALEEAGELFADEQSMDCPIARHLEGNIEDINAELKSFEESGVCPNADDSLRLIGSLVCTAPVGPEVLTTIRNKEDLNAFLVRISENNPEGFLTP